MPMMMSQILESVGFTRTEKSRYLKKKTLGATSIYMSRATLFQKTVF